jgi:hypothetical protein
MYKKLNNVPNINRIMISMPPDRRVHWQDCCASGAQQHGESRDASASCPKETCFNLCLICRHARRRLVKLPLRFCLTGLVLLVLCPTLLQLPNAQVRDDDVFELSLFG